MPDFKRTVEISSEDSRFSTLEDAPAIAPASRGTTLSAQWATKHVVRTFTTAPSSLSTEPAIYRYVALEVDSKAKTATVTYKPIQLAKEERQERMNKVIRQGFVPPVRSTAK